MPPIKRNQKPAAAPTPRRLAGHTGPARPGASGSSSGVSGGVRPSAHGTGVVDDEAGQHVDATAAETEDSSRRRRPDFGRGVVYAALVVGVAAGAAGLYLATEPGISVPNQAFVDREATTEVLAAASTNVQRLVSIDHQTLDEYHASLGEFLTPNLVAELDSNWPALKDSYEQTATTVDANVREAGLTYLEGDRAEVLLVQDVSMERDGVAAGSTSGTYLVGLDRVDGVWKLSRIPDLPS